MLPTTKKFFFDKNSNCAWNLNSINAFFELNNKIDSNSIITANHVKTHNNKNVQAIISGNFYIRIQSILHSRSRFARKSCKLSRIESIYCKKSTALAKT